jgi:hypothetical protein
MHSVVFDSAKRRRYVCSNDVYLVEYPRGVAGVPMDGNPLAPGNAGGAPQDEVDGRGLRDGSRVLPVLFDDELGVTGA